MNLFLVKSCILVTLTKLSHVSFCGVAKIDNKILVHTCKMRTSISTRIRNIFLFHVHAFLHITLVSLVGTGVK